MNARSFSATAVLATSAMVLSGCAGTPSAHGLSGSRLHGSQETCWRVTAPAMSLNNRVLCGTESQWAEFRARAGVTPAAWKDMQHDQYRVQQAHAGSRSEASSGIAPAPVMPYLPLQPDRFLVPGAL